MKHKEEILKRLEIISLEYSKLKDETKKLKIQNKELKQKFSLYGVVKSFYCVNKEVGYRDNICLDQCITCGMKEKAQ
jgi:hypothetical protein